jgi:hypothetical protein
MTIEQVGQVRDAERFRPGGLIVRDFAPLFFGMVLEPGLFLPVNGGRKVRLIESREAGDADV